MNEEMVIQGGRLHCTDIGVPGTVYLTAIFVLGVIVVPFP